MKEQLEEAYSNLKDRFKNSFIITFVLVWIVYHWELIYSVLNFDSYEFRDSKIEFIKQYLKGHNMIWWPALIAITSMLILYCIFIFSEVIHSYYGIARNNILKKIGDSKKVIEIEKYNELGKQLERIRSRAGEYQIKESEYILSKQDLENEVSSLHNQLEQANSQLSANADSISGLGRIQEENGKNLIKITELELEKIALQQDLTKVTSESIRLRNVQDNYLKEKKENDYLRSYQLWTYMENESLALEWSELSNEDRNFYMKLFKNVSRVKSIFGDHFWHHSTISKISDVQSTLKFIDFPIPYFESVAGKPVYYLKDIVPFGNDGIELILHKVYETKEVISLKIGRFSGDEIDGTYNSIPITFYKQ